MRSALVVISWWSNCLALASLHNLVRYTRQRAMLVVQVGKPEEQKERFRAHLPPTVQELPYPAERTAEDWRVRETVARELLGEREGVWFIDHDLFVREDAEGWLEDMDCRFEGSNVCLCHPSPVRGPTITNPAFWLSPPRFPPGMPGFARLPYQEEPLASRPYAARAAPGSDRPAALMLPEKDTLVAAREFLLERGMVCGFPLTEADRAPGGPAPFPRFEHIGGLYTFTGDVPPLALHSWVARCVARFTAFYQKCPPEWVAIEEPMLLRRLEEFQEAISRRKHEIPSP